MPVLTARGYRGPGLGRAAYVEAPPEWRGTTVQVCGLWPWAAGGTSPTVGVPLGHNLRTGRAVSFDPLNWFSRARLLANPSATVLGLPALGKSTLVRRLVIGLAPTATPLILGDLKPDYAEVVRALGGQVIRLGRGHGALNLLDVGAMDEAAAMIGGREAEALREEAHGRRLNIVKAQLAVVRGSRTRDYEDTVLSASLRLLTKRSARRKHAPLLRDLITLISEGPDEVRLVTLDRGDDARYRDTVDPLLRSLMALVDGPLGQMFGRPTTERIRLDATAVCVDVSDISASDRQLQAAALLACWAAGFGTVEAGNALADAGTTPQRTFLVILDELWRVVRAGEGLVDRVDELTRLNRSTGVGQILVTHSMADLRALDSQADREKARGFVERSGAVVCGGLPAQELDDLDAVVGFSDEERQLITSWSTPPGWSAADEPPGRGNFVVKVGQRPGLPVHVDLTPAELAGINDTNKRWRTR